MRFLGGALFLSLGLSSLSLSSGLTQQSYRYAYDHTQASTLTGPPLTENYISDNINDSSIGSICQTVCACFTIHDIPECLSLCQRPQPPATHLINVVDNQPDNPFNKNETLAGVCPRGYAPTPTATPVARKVDDGHMQEIEAKHENAHTLSGSKRLHYAAHKTKKAKNASKKPNIILFLMDDQDQVSSPYLSAMPFASSLFSTGGAHFVNGFTSSSICCAARCQLLTGLLGHNVGVLTNAGDFGGFGSFSHPLTQYSALTSNSTRMKNADGQCINNEMRTFPKILQEQGGYYTGLIGKYINGLEDDAGGVVSHASPGWSRFIVPADHTFYAGYNYTLADFDAKTGKITSTFYGANETDYSTDVVSKLATSLISSVRASGDSSPFFLYLASTAPHLPLSAAKRHRAKVDEWRALYSSSIGPESGRPNFYAANMTTKPTWLQSSIKQRDKVDTVMHWNEIDFAKRMGSLYALDEMIESVYNEIKNAGELDNTYFVLTADNGYNLGAQHLVHKMAPYEESIRIPMFMSGPGIAPGSTVDEMSLLIDMAPTFLSLAGLTPPSYLDGHSLIDFLNLTSSSSSSLSSSLSSSSVVSRSDILLQYGSYGLAEILGNGIVKEFTPEQISQLPIGFLDDLPAYLGLRSLTHLFVAWHFTPGTNETLPDDAPLYTVSEAASILSAHPTAMAAAMSTDDAIVHEYELYDLVNDPHQLTNLLGVQNVAKEDLELAKSMQARMYKLFTCSGLSCLTSEL